MTHQMSQAKSEFNITALFIVIVAVVMILSAHCGPIAAAELLTTQDSVINYQSQSDLFAAGQGAVPFLVENPVTHNTKQPHSEQASTKTKPRFALMSLSPMALTGHNSETTIPPATETDSNQVVPPSEFTPANQPSITELADTLQWTILLLTAVAAGVIGVHRMTKNKQNTQSSHRMEYQGCLPVRGQFSMHLVTITDRQFLVTTDRSGVKTVNALNDWDQFAAPIDPTLDDQFPELSIESKPHHHG